MSDETTACCLLAAFAILLVAAQPSTAVSTCPSGNPDCSIQDLPNPVSGAELLAGLSNATRRLTLRNLSLKDWPAEATGRSGQLESLELDRVASASPPAPGGDRLQGGSLPGLRTLRVRGGAGSSCPFSAVFAAFPALEELEISGCRLAAPLNDAWLRRLPQLRRLTVDGAKLDSLHLAGLDWETRAALRDLRLTNNNFNTLADDSFGSMPNLTSLILDGNIIQYIQPAAFAQLPALTQLSIVLPKEGQLAKIWEASLDGRFDNNTRLEVLRLVNARLAEEQISRSFDQLKDLRELNLSGHRLRSLHNSVLSSLTALELLDLSNGSLICLYDRNFGVMSRLRQLELANNGIRVIGKRALLGLPALTRLNLAGNPIEAVELGAFCTHRPDIRDAGLLATWGLDPGRVEGGANITDPCPPDFNPNKLILSSKPQCLLPRSPGGSDVTDASKKPGEQSRHTFLIIIGLCVAFLLITVIAMMAYKGWSKRKNAQLAKDEEKELELQAMVVAAAAEEGGDVSASGVGSKKPAPQNGRQHHHRHHRQPGSEKSSKHDEADGAAAASEGPAAATAGAPSQELAAAAAGSAPPPENTVETTAQVESPERCGSQQQHSPSPTTADASPAPNVAPAASAKPPMRPGITLMTTVPEDSDLEARAITTLVVV